MIPQEQHKQNAATVKINLQPIVDISPQLHDDESIEIIATKNFKLTQDFNTTNKMQQSYNSTSTNNTDICILEAHESHYADKIDNTHFHALETNDFTLLDVPSQRGYVYCAFDESTEVLLEHSECHVKPACSFSGTDSDVEVLNDSDWSTGVPQSLDDLHSELNADILQVMEPVSIIEKTSCSNSLKHEESTDRDISLEEFSRSSCSDYEHCNRSQLLNIIKDQAIRIQQLETKLKRFNIAHQQIYKYVDALRSLDLKTNDSSEN